MKRAEFLEGITAENIYPKLSPEEIWKICKKFSNIDQFLGESKTTISPLSEVEINGYFLYLTGYAEAPITELSKEEKLQIVRDHLEELKEKSLISSTDEKRVALEKSMSTVKKRFNTGNFRVAINAYFKHLKDASI